MNVATSHFYNGKIIALRSHRGSVLFSSEEGSVAGSASVSMTTHSSPTRGERLAAEEAMLDDPDHDDHYIYVTYPPELKRRLLERYEANKITLIILSPYIRQTRVD